jgi:hypothetical protein
MGGKYITGVGPGGVFSNNSGVCSTAAAGSGAVAFDGPTTVEGVVSHVYRNYGIPQGGVPVDTFQKMCWKVSGRAVIINDKEFSVQAGFEMVNFNFHTSGTQPALSTYTNIVGTVGV